MLLNLVYEDTWEKMVGKFSADALINTANDG